MELKREIVKKFSQIMPLNEAQSEVEFILREHFNYPLKSQITNPEKILEFKNELTKIIETRLQTKKPLQYIINKAAFFNDLYYVDENVLIPRPETELLVKETAIYARDFKDPKILDIGTGSGCIAITLAKLLNSNNISASDISKKALEVAKLNASRLCPDKKINFICSDLFKNINDKFDIIVSNPPYIDPAMREDMQPEVTEYEPNSALFAPEKGMYFYEQIIGHANNFLNEKGILAFEAGIKQASKIQKLLENKGFNKVIIIPDFSSIDRIVLGMLSY